MPEPYIFELAPGELAAPEDGTEAEETPPEPKAKPAPLRFRLPRAAWVRLQPSAAEEPAAVERPVTKEPVVEEPVAERRLTLRLPRWRPVTVMLILALAAVSTFTVWQWRRAHDLSAETAQRRVLEQSSAKVATTFFNWDYQHMQASFTAKYALLTKSAADAIRPTAPTLTAYFTTNKASSTARIDGIYPGEIKGEGASVVVAVDTRVTTSSSIQTNTGATLLLSMRRVSGRWLANNIALTGTGQESYTDPQGKPITAPSSSAAPSARPSASPTP